MRRRFSVVALTLVLYTAALVLGSLAICEASEVIDAVGEWATHGHAAQVRIERCATTPDALCGTVTWLWEPVDANGQPVRDTKNPEPRLRKQSVIGLSLLREFRYRNGEELTEGQIYNPENGRTYRASLRLRSPDTLEVKGCLLFLCETQWWRRIESLCSRSRQVGTQ